MSSLPFPHTTTKKNVRYVSFTYTHTHRHLHLHCMNNQPSVISLKPFRKRKPFRSLYKTCCCKCLAVPTKTTMWCVSSCRLWSCWKKASVLYAQSVFYAALHKKASASCCRERGSLLWSTKKEKKKRLVSLLLLSVGGCSRLYSSTLAKRLKSIHMQSARLYPAHYFTNTFTRKIFKIYNNSLTYTHILKTYISLPSH